MALSYYSNWAAFQQLDSDMSILDPSPPPELPPELLPWNMDHLFESDELFYSQNYNSVLYDFSSAVAPHDNVESHNQEPLLLQQEFEPLYKHQKGSDYEEVYSVFEPAFFNGLVPNPSPMLQDCLPLEIGVPALPDFPAAPPVYSGGSCETLKKETSSGSLSAQSIAARQRRRKITEKTQELGKLVPGGQKMNTAEMLQAAYKYIKFLQAQVGVLEFLGSYDDHQENGEPLESDEDLQALLESPLIQEKLYSTEKCLVPQKFVEERSSDHKNTVKSYPQLLQTVKQEQ